MYNHIPDYNELYDIYEARQARYASVDRFKFERDPFEDYPICAVCNEHITDEELYDWDGATFHHLDCYEDEDGSCKSYIKPTADYIGLMC